MKAQRGGKPLKAAEAPAITSDSHIHLSTKLAEHLLEVTSSKTHAPTYISLLPNTPSNMAVFSAYISGSLCVSPSPTYASVS